MWAHLYVCVWCTYTQKQPSKSTYTYIIAYMYMC